ncbi:hypothetical protein [Mycobacterium sp. EPa45]|uniref:hypothetical protein n=1 Tax=Mycobacterium sp. EPa45 TaxID=1545728 RepID=UPI00130D86C6|nr:hypothetical protein [Mycobacterium sp. EPa45]
MPIAIAILVGLLVHWAVLPTPKNEAHVALAAGADPSPAEASAPAVNVAAAMPLRSPLMLAI